MEKRASARNFLDRFVFSLILITLPLNGFAFGNTVNLFADNSNRLSLLPRDNRPNVVLINTDDLSDAVRTDSFQQELEYMPNLQRLMREQGVTFENSFVSSSLCCPSRTSLLRGQYIHNHQIYTNAPPDGGFEKAFQIGLENSTLATWLNAAGYKTAHFGKYLNGYPFQTAPPGTPGDPRRYIPPGWDEWYSPTSNAGYSGFDYELNENGTIVSYIDEDPNENNPRNYLTDVLTRKAVNFIARAEENNRPFFAYIAPYVPHAPSTPAPRHAELFQSARTPRTPSFNEADVSDKPSFIKRLNLLTNGDIRAIDASFVKRVQSLQAVDEMIGILISELARTNQLENTYLIFTADNGYHLGQHRLKPGKFTAYEEDIRVPLIVRGPGVPRNSSLRHLVFNIDLAPTIADLAKTAPPSYVDGRSLAPLLGSDLLPISVWRQVFLVEQYPFMGHRGNRENSADFAIEPYENVGTMTPLPVYTGIRTDRYKYVEHRNQETGNVELEFYDLRNDPYELNNIQSSVPPETLQRFSEKMRELYKCAGSSCRAEDSTLP